MPYLETIYGILNDVKGVFVYTSRSSCTCCNRIFIRKKKYNGIVMFVYENAQKLLDPKKFIED